MMLYRYLSRKILQKNETKWIKSILKKDHNQIVIRKPFVHLFLFYSSFKIPRYNYLIQMVRSCPHCGSCDIDEDAARGMFSFMDAVASIVSLLKYFSGDATCTNCGAVLEESIVVSENQFQERAGGSGHTLVGKILF